MPVSRVASRLVSAPVPTFGSSRKERSGHVHLIEVISRPRHGVTLGDVATIYYAESDRAEELLAATELAQVWLEWAEERAR